MSDVGLFARTPSLKPRRHCRKKITFIPMEQTGHNTIAQQPLGKPARGTGVYIRNGQAFYWASFFMLIGIEFLLGGQLSRMLTKENYAVYISVLNYLPFYTILANLGLSYGIVYIIAWNRQLRYPLFRETIKLQSAWYVVLIALHTILLLIFRDIYTRTLLVTLVISYTYTSKLNITSFFLASKNYNKAAFANVLQKVALCILLFLLLRTTTATQLLNNHFWSLYPAMELGVILLYIVFFMPTARQLMAAPAISYRRRLLRFGRYAMVNNGLNVLYFTILALIIRSSALPLHVQIISGLCIVFFRYSAVAVAPLFAIMSPQLTGIKNNTTLVAKMYKRYLLATVVMGVAILLGYRLLFGFVIHTFYAPAYHDLPAYFYYFAWLVPLLFISSLHATMLSALGKIKYTLRTEIFCTALLALFFCYNLFLPVTGYLIFYYFVVAHTCLKCLLLSYGVYRKLNSPNIYQKRKLIQ